MSISRVDHAPRHTFGYYVRVRRDGIIHSKFFSDARAGGKKAAFKLAKEFEAELITELDSRPKKAKPPTPSVRNKSGVVGVSRTKTQSGRNIAEYWQAHWSDETGRRRSARFSVGTYGEEKAFRLASKARKEGMASVAQARNA